MSKKQAVEDMIEEFLKLYQLDSYTTEDTPRRVSEFWEGFLNQSPPRIMVEPRGNMEEVRLDNYTTWGMCPHHLLPVRYTVSITYSPNKTVVGISKLPRIVDYKLRLLPLQEDLPGLVCDFIMAKIKPNWVECTVQGMHLCMIMRGVKANDGTTLTTKARRP